MKTKRKRTTRYGIAVLRLVKKWFPEIYEVKIKGRIDEFIKEHIPTGAISGGERVGKVTKDLQLLWALHGLFFQLSGNSDDLLQKEFCNASEALNGINAYSSDSMGAACRVLFWSAIIRGLSGSSFELGKFVLSIQHDWSITMKPRTEVSQNSLEEAERGLPYALLFLIERQMMIHDLAEYVQKRK